MTPSLTRGAPVRTLGRMRGSLTVWFMSRFVGPLFLWRAAYSLYLPPCRGKVSWPTAMTDEGAFSDSSRNVQKPFLFPCRKKKRFLESKEKGAPVGVRWLQIGFRRPGFTPPLWSDPVHGGLPGRNRENRWSYPTFFRRLRGWGLPRGLAGGRRPPLQRRHVCGWGRGDLWSPAAPTKDCFIYGARRLGAPTVSPLKPVILRRSRRIRPFVP